MKQVSKFLVALALLSAFVAVAVHCQDAEEAVEAAANMIKPKSTKFQKQRPQKQPCNCNSSQNSDAESTKSSSKDSDLDSDKLGLLSEPVGLIKNSPISAVKSVVNSAPSLFKVGSSNAQEIAEGKTNIVNEGIIGSADKTVEQVGSKLDAGIKETQNSVNNKSPINVQGPTASAVNKLGSGNLLNVQPIAELSSTGGEKGGSLLSPTLINKQVEQFTGGLTSIGNGNNNKQQQQQSNVDESSTPNEDNDDKQDSASPVCALEVRKLPPIGSKAAQILKRQLRFSIGEQRSLIIEILKKTDEIVALALERHLDIERIKAAVVGIQELEVREARGIKPLLRRSPELRRLTGELRRLGDKVKELC